MKKITPKEKKEYREQSFVLFKQLKQLVGIKNLQEYEKVEKKCIELFNEIFGEDMGEFFYALSYMKWEKGELTLVDNIKS